MRIQHNIASLNAYRNYTNNTTSVSKNLEKLSSGYRINRAGDDAAGLAISEKMRAQITGLETAQKNAADGISLVQTAEGALTEVHTMLNRMVELADQSANGTYDDAVDRANLQKEVKNLKDEIDRIADSTNFNGIDLLNGKLSGTVQGAVDGLKPGEGVGEDGVTGSAGTKATFGITFGAAGPSKLFGNNFTGTTVQNLMDQKIGGTTGPKVSDLFDVYKADGTTVAGVGDGLANAEFKLVAKNAGNLDTSVVNAMKDAFNGATAGHGAVSSFKDGTAIGSGSPATAAQYNFEIDLTKLSGGQTFKIGDKTFEIVTGDSTKTNGTALANGNIAINITNLDSKDPGTAGTGGGTASTGQIAIAEKIQEAIDKTLGQQATGNDKIFTTKKPVPADIVTNVFKFSMTATKTGADGNLGQVRVTGDGITATYTAGKLEGKGEQPSFATVTYDNFDLNKLQAGTKITIGGTSIEVVKDDAEDLANGKIGITKAKNPADLIAAFEGMGYAAGKITIDGNKLTITDTTVGQAGDALAAGNGKLTVEGGSADGSMTGGLTLQIGDTSAKWNKLTVRIDDTHVANLGIESVDIGTQESAGKAVDMIKKAINKVSDIRGTLGATQNRLEHTINNLSVTTENMTAAESRIRDVDVAKEMMAYTKNNILVQSAQAMLAQANQTPQGVLQLLQ